MCELNVVDKDDEATKRLGHGKECCCRYGACSMDGRIRVLQRSTDFNELPYWGSGRWQPDEAVQGWGWEDVRTHCFSEALQRRTLRRLLALTH